MVRVLLLAVVIRILAGLLIDWQASVGLGDSAYYLAGTLDGFRAPVFSLVAGTLGRGTIILNLLLGIACGGLVWWGFRRTRFGALAGAVIALSPIPIPVEYLVLSETLYGFLVLLAVMLLCRDLVLPAGLALGVALLTRDNLLLLPLFFIPFLPWKKGLALVAAAYVVALPYYASVEGNGRLGFNLWIGTWEREAWGGADPIPERAFTSPAQQAELTAAYARGDLSPFRAAAIERMRQDPGFVLTSWTMRYPNQWLSTRTELNVVREPARLALKLGGFAVNLVVLLLGIAGLFLYWRRYKPLVPPIAYAALASIPLHNSEPRYFLYAFPMLTIFAVMAASAAVRRGQGRGLLGFLPAPPSPPPIQLARRTAT